MCLSTCKDDYDTSTNYWSENGARAGKTYGWNELGTAYGLYSDYNITAFGWVPPMTYVTVIAP